MTDDELRFFELCGPLEDAMELIDAGKTDAAKALLQRILSAAEAECLSGNQSKCCHKE